MNTEMKSHLERLLQENELYNLLLSELSSSGGLNKRLFNIFVN